MPRKPKPKPKYSYAVRWRRQFQPYRQVRFFERVQYAERYAARLRAGTRLGLDPLVELVVQRRVVGPWEDVEPPERWSDTTRRSTPVEQCSVDCTPAAVEHEPEWWEVIEHELGRWEDVEPW